VFENEEIATGNNIFTTDLIKGSGPLMQYLTMKCADGSTIVVKGQGTIGGAAVRCYHRLRMDPPPTEMEPINRFLTDEGSPE
jgi:hypothetical protein